jgi:hypothetical protein
MACFVAWTAAFSKARTSKTHTSCETLTLIEVQFSRDKEKLGIVGGISDERNQM